MKEKNNGKSVAELMIIIDGLTREEQNAICLAIRNIEAIRAICRNPGTTHRGINQRSADRCSSI